MGNRVKAKWTGSYPTKCMGEWKLYLDGKDISNKIPKSKRECSMNTFGTYEQWHFVNWLEEFESYEDGLHCDEWIKENEKWLSKITDNKELQEEIYKAFQAEDWRLGECGGCI